MSTRFYPRYVKGNPQLRIFLPDWKMIMVKPPEPLPENVVVFKTDIKMTDWDIKNYLDKIYNLKISGLSSTIVAGKLRRSSKGITKNEDYKLARVYLPMGQTFKWPELYPQEKREEEIDDYKKTLEMLTKDRKIDPNKSGLPGWFS